MGLLAALATTAIGRKKEVTLLENELVSSLVSRSSRVKKSLDLSTGRVIVPLFTFLHRSIDMTAPLMFGFFRNHGVLKQESRIRMPKRSFVKNILFRSSRRIALFNISIAHLLLSKKVTISFLKEDDNPKDEMRKLWLDDLKNISGRLEMIGYGMSCVLSAMQFNSDIPIFKKQNNGGLQV